MFEVRISLLQDGNVHSDAPAATFEDLNPAMNYFNRARSFSLPSHGSFANAIGWLRAGYKVCRPTWTEGSYILIHNDRIMFSSSSGYLSPARGVLESQGLLATDWTILQEETANA